MLGDLVVGRYRLLAVVQGAVIFAVLSVHFFSRGIVGRLRGER